ncbi:MAG TPA: FAD:protein FMN transferase [Vicinamibacterales bacterium]|nr:FAD:protein FMN transferase [Vicinamibacterales bacterium]
MAKRPRPRIGKWPLCWFAFSLLPVLLPHSASRAQAQPASERHVSEFRGLTMGGTFSVKIVTPKDELETPGLDDVDRALRSTLDRIEGLMSTWDQDSELSRFNRSTSLEPFAVSPETFEVFKWSIEVGGLTGGALDVTIGPLVDAWGFGPGGHRNTLPTDEEIARLRKAIGPGRIELNAANQTVRKTRPEVRCDLSSVVPGYAADRLWTALTDRRFTDFLVDVGGEVRTRGRNQAGAPWQVAVERPVLHGDAIQRLVPISDLAITTAGDYRKYREVDGQRIAHILDPRTGRPLTHRLASVTVIDALAVRADAFDTALMVLGPDEGMALATKLNLAALFIERTGDGFTERATARFDEIVAKR